MEKVYNISEVRFDKNHLILIINNQTIKLELARISEKLYRATDRQKNDYKISPSGYGIHWRQLDEDLSINGLLKVDNSTSLSRV
jgi:hypothetical protein